MTNSCNKYKILFNKTKRLIKMTAQTEHLSNIFQNTEHFKILLVHFSVSVQNMSPEPRHIDRMESPLGCKHDSCRISWSHL